jgi:hypothetical protein
MAIFYGGRNKKAAAASSPGGSAISFPQEVIPGSVKMVDGRLVKLSSFHALDEAGETVQLFPGLDIGQEDARLETLVSEMRRERTTGESALRQDLDSLRADLDLLEEDESTTNSANGGDVIEFPAGSTLRQFVSAATLNAAAAGDASAEASFRYEVLNPGTRQAARRCGAKPLVAFAEDVITAAVGDPSLIGTGAACKGFGLIRMMLDTDAGATKTYAANTALAGTVTWDGTKDVVFTTNPATINVAVDTWIRDDADGQWFRAKAISGAGPYTVEVHNDDQQLIPSGAAGSSRTDSVGVTVTFPNVPLYSYLTIQHWILMSP